MSYDPWGKRRESNGASDIHNSVSSKTTRGFTGQEEVQNATTGFELVNMNARLYDPMIGRFLSTDPALPKAGEQADLINPYTYCDNNPLSLTDPTGASILGIIGAIVAIIIAVVFQLYYLLPVLEAAEFGGVAATYEVGIYAVVNAALVGGIAGAADGAISSGGNLDATLEGLGIGAATGAGFGAVGHFTDGGSGSLLAGDLTKSIGSTAATDADYLAQVAGDGLVGGLSSVAEGGNFGSGFLAAGFSNAFGYSLLGKYVMNNGGNLSAYNVAEQAVTGGIGSVLGGGTFENGAITGSFRYLFNELGAYAQKGETAAQAECNYGGFSLCYSTVSGGPGQSQWDIHWWVSDSLDGGWIVQQIDASGNGNSETYWEAWPISPGADVSSLALPDGTNDEFMGWSNIQASARFYSGLSLPNSFIPNNPNTTAGILPATTSNPNLPVNNATPPVDRSWSP